MRVIGLIAVRMKSGRLKNKAMADLCGRPLIVRLAQRVQLCAKLDKVVLCTSTHSEDDILQKIGQEYGIPVFRGHEDDVMQRFLDCAADYGAQHIVRITGDNPLVDPQVMERLIDSHLEKNADYTRMDGLPEGITSEVIAVEALKKAHALSENPNHSEYMTWYFTKNNVFKLNILQAPPELSRACFRLTVDYEEDLCLIKRIYEEFDFDYRPPSLLEIIQFLDTNPKVSVLNRNITRVIPIQEINTRLRTSTP